LVEGGFQCTYGEVPDCCVLDAECDDGDDCTADACVNNACSNQGLGCCTTDQECGDGNGCTIDTCTADGACLHTEVPDCCIDDADCADDDPCTDDACVFYECNHEAVANCCIANQDCGAAGSCTDVACVNGSCQYNPIADCCTNNTHCDDGDACTVDSCMAGSCVNTPTGQCCLTDAQCDDGLPCTLDLCENNACTHESWPGCCAFDEECEDDDPCTVNKCNTGTGECQFLQSSCCASDAECEDADPCTLDICTGGACDFVAGDECVTLIAVADCWLEGSNNHGGDGFVIIGKTGDFQKKRSLVRFDTSSIPQDTQILAANLNVYYQWSSKPSWLPNEQGIDRFVQVHKVLKHWEENQATADNAANNSPWAAAYVGLDGVDADIEPLDTDLWPVEVYEWKTFDVTPAAQAWIAQPADNHGVLLWATNEDESGMDMRMPSREFSDDTSLRPKLTVIYE